MSAARAAILAVASLLSSMGSAGSQVPQRDLQTAGSALRAMPPDPRIQVALRQISVANIRHTINTLVGFGTRSTLSSMRSDLPAGQGIAPAAQWIRKEFERYSAACGGCLQVRLDTFVAAPGERLPVATRITNVFAVRLGSDPAQAGRVLLVTGHYDSRNSDVLDG